MREYYRQIKILTAIALSAFAVLLIFVCFSSRGKLRIKNTPALAVTSEKASDITRSERIQKPPKNSAASEVFVDFPVNINTADAKTLMNIPGIGEAKANEIIAYRNANGKFKKAEDLINVYGINEKTLEKIYGYITV